MSEHDAMIEKVKKLLRLSQSDNVNEAALAAAKAQELIDRHNLNTALLELDANRENAPPEEDIFNFRSNEDTLTPGEKTVATWKWRLALTIANHNAVELYVMNYRQVVPGKAHPDRMHGIFCVGRPSDVAAVRYLFGYCVREVERLFSKLSKGHGRVYYNNYRLGVVDAIKEQLQKQREEFAKSARKEARGAGGPTGHAALVKVDSALARLDDKAHETKKWVKKNMKLKNTYGGGHVGNDSARARGQKDGKSINLGAGKGLGTGNSKALPR